MYRCVMFKKNGLHYMSMMEKWEIEKIYDDHK